MTNDDNLFKKLSVLKRAGSFSISGGAMIHILIYGDSNTFGCNPAASSGADPEEPFRYEKESRWPECLKKELGPGWEVIAEGLPGRTAALDEPFKPYRKGSLTFTAIVRSHYPVDLLIFMLGTNDLKFSHTPEYVAKSMEVLLEMAYNPYSWERQKCPRVLLIAPPKLSENIRSSCFYGMFTEESVQISGRIGKLYKKLAEKWKCDFLDAAEFVKASPVDCVHLEREGHKILAKAVAEKIKAMFRR